MLAGRASLGSNGSSGSGEAADSPSARFQCDTCTLINTNPAATRCQLCGAPRRQHYVQTAHARGSDKNAPAATTTPPAAAAGAPAPAPSAPAPLEASPLSPPASHAPSSEPPSPLPPAAALPQFSDDDLSSDEGDLPATAAAPAAVATASALPLTAAAPMDVGPSLALPSDTHAPPAEGYGTEASVLPLSLRLSSLRCTPLQAHLLLFPSHKNDLTYVGDTSVLASDRKTSFETAGPLEAFGCPVVMNTPEQLINYQADAEELAEGRMLTAAPANEQARGEQMTAAVPEVLGSLPTFLLAADPQAADAPAVASADTGALLPGWVQCSKCSKWRSVPDEWSAASFPAEWSCEHIQWDSVLARCSAPEEVFDDGELWTGMPKRFTRFVDTDRFYRQLVSLLQAHDDSDSDASTELDKFPQVRRRPVELHLMYRTVLALGGYDKVCASNQWRTVQSCLHIPDAHDSSLTLKRLYRRVLYEYERHYWHNPRPRTHTNTPPLPAAKLAARTPKPVAASSTGAVAHAVADVPARKRRHRDALDAEDEGDATRKRSRKPHQVHAQQQQQAGMAQPASGQLDAAEYTTGRGDDDMSEAESKQNLAPRARSAAAASHLSGVVDEVRSEVSARFRAFEARMDNKLSRLEQVLLEAIQQCTSSVNAQLASTLQAQTKRIREFQREQQRREEQIARGINMIITDRLRHAAAPAGHSGTEADPHADAEAEEHAAMDIAAGGSAEAVVDDVVGAAAPPLSVAPPAAAPPTIAAAPSTPPAQHLSFDVPPTALSPAAAVAAAAVSSSLRVPCSPAPHSLAIAELHTSPAKFASSSAARRSSSPAAAASPAAAVSAAHSPSKLSTRAASSGAASASQSPTKAVAAPVAPSAPQLPPLSLGNKVATPPTTPKLHSRTTSSTTATATAARSPRTPASSKKAAAHTQQRAVMRRAKPSHYALFTSLPADSENAPTQHAAANEDTHMDAP